MRHGQTGWMEGGGQHVEDTSYGDEVRMRRDRDVWTGVKRTKEDAWRWDVRYKWS